MCVALSFPMASLLLQPCFTSPLWSWWKTSQVKTQTHLNWTSTLLLLKHISRCYRGCIALTYHFHPSVYAALKRVEVEECMRWMVPFAMALREAGGSPMKTFTGIPADDMHNIQTHVPYLTWLVSKSIVMTTLISQV